MVVVQCVVRVIGAVAACVVDHLRMVWRSFKERHALAAEILLLRRQLALFLERGARPRRLSPAERLGLARLSGFVRSWREALVVVKPETLIRWHRAGFRQLWRWRSRRIGRPPIPRELQARIAEMARDNPTWTARQIHKKLLLKVGIRTSSETVRRYMPQRPDGRSGSGRGRGDQRWATFVRNHAQGGVAL